jgi:phosphoglycerate dehydrogenase-like enzyme
MQSPNTTTVAFLHTNSEHASQLSRALRSRLPRYEIFSWLEGHEPPARDIHILLALGAVRRDHLVLLPALELVQTLSDGYENVDLRAAAELGIWVSNAPSGLTGNAESVAEFAVLLLIGAARQLARAIRLQADPPAGTVALHKSLEGKTLCVVGLGSIGRHLVPRLQAFGLTVVATDHHLEDPPPGVRVYPAHELTTAIAAADYVVICVPGSAANENLFNASVFGAMKRGSILVNVARGNLIDEAALGDALRSGQISAVGLDVLRLEGPFEPSPLRRFSQALITPHLAGDTDLSLAGTVRYVGNLVDQWRDGIKPDSLVNLPDHPRRVPCNGGVALSHTRSSK